MNFNFQLEENDVLQNFLDTELLNFPTFTEKLNKISKKKKPLVSGIEFIVRPECNQKCEYCYITQHGEELYPKEKRADNKTILKNLDIMLNYLIDEKQYFIQRWELFAGDLFYDNLFFDIMNIFEQHFEKQIINFEKVFLDNQILIIIPCNFSFSKDKEKIEKLITTVERFKDKYNVRISLSISTDGKFVTQTREKEENDKFYENLFNLSRKLHYRFHPMISSSNVKNWIENYDWWIDMFAKHYSEENFELDFQPMMLEVRNNDWTEQSLSDYKDLLIHIFEKRLKMCDNDIDKLTYHLFKGDGKDGGLRKLEQTDPIGLISFSSNNSRMPCSIQSLLHITLNNLALVPCHRLTYEQFVGGHYIQEEGKIIGVEAKNISNFINTFYITTTYLPKCAKCIYRNFCMKGCWGAQYEVTGELYEPSINTCAMLKTKYKTIFTLYFNYGIIESAVKQKLISELEYDHIKEVLEHIARGK